MRSRGLDHGGNQDAAALRPDGGVGRIAEAFRKHRRARWTCARPSRSDAGRFEALSQQAPHVFADLSKNLIDTQAEALLLQLARECGLERHRDAMFAGEPINNTEDRAVKHWLLRAPQATQRATAGCLAEVHATLDAMLAYAEQVRGDARSPTS